MTLKELMNKLTHKQQSDIKKVLEKNRFYIKEEEKPSFILGWFEGMNAVYQESLQPREDKS